LSWLHLAIIAGCSSSLVFCITWSFIAAGGSLFDALASAISLSSAWFASTWALTALAIFVQSSLLATTISTSLSKNAMKRSAVACDSGSFFAALSSALAAGLSAGLSAFFSAGAALGVSAQASGAAVSAAITVSVRMIDIGSPLA